MKKLRAITLFIILCIASFKLFAQNDLPVPSTLTPAQRDDLVRSLRAGRYNIKADKTLLGANEPSNLSVYLATVHADPEGAAPPTPGTPVDLTELERLMAGTSSNTSGSFTTSWRIVQGGGTLTMTDKYNYTYTAPAHAPQDNIMIIAVDLNPTGGSSAKVELLITLNYFDGDNAFTFDVPEAGINDDMYSENNKDAVGLPTLSNMDPRVLASLPAADRQKLAVMQQQVKSLGNVNVSALTSNASALYSVKDNKTIIKFTQLALKHSNGDTPGSTGGPGSNILVISFSGRPTKGTHSLDDEKDAIGLTVPGDMSRSCFCSKSSNSSLQKLPCRGNVVITAVDDKSIKGYIISDIYNTPATTFFQGSFYGKFNIPMVNLN